MMAPLTALSPEVSMGGHKDVVRRKGETIGCKSGRTTKTQSKILSSGEGVKKKEFLQGQKIVSWTHGSLVPTLWTPEEKPSRFLEEMKV